MNILLLTIGAFKNVSENGAYTDLLRYFQKKGHQVYVVCTRERRQGLPTCLEEQDGIKILRVRTGNITKAPFIEKGISTLLIESQYKYAINKFFNNIKFDLITYSTPPITLAGVIGSVKKKNGSFTYLMLKDIFPAGAVDLGVLTESGIKGIICRYFRHVEKKLYDISDAIGCMSKANVNYLLDKNPQINVDKVGLCPNTIDVFSIEHTDRTGILKKYKIPEDRILFIYGGNFGLPQNVDYIIQVLKKAEHMDKVHFIMCGSGTEFYKIQEYHQTVRDEFMTVIDALPYHEYKQLLAACDAGMLFLDYRFHVPNFPSRLLDYMNYELPVLAATDVNTDVGKTILDGEFGWWCESRDAGEYESLLGRIVEEAEQNPEYLKEKGRNAKEYLTEHFRTEIAYSEITAQYEKWLEGSHVH